MRSLFEVLVQIYSVKIESLEKNFRISSTLFKYLGYKTRYAASYMPMHNIGYNT